ncbi:MAG: hypothetical protein ACLGHO_11155 [Gammaproteobacteria bacterium]
MRGSFITLCLVAAALFSAGAGADDAKSIALQISDGSQEKQELVLNVASNLLKAYGPDRVKIEVVAFGPGLRLLFADNALRDRVQSLAASGVRFSACQNTVANMTRLLGHPPALNPEAQSVPAGVIRMVELNESGYLLVRP